MDTKCAADNCAALKRQTDAQAIACTKAQAAKYNIGDDQCECLCVWKVIGKMLISSSRADNTAWTVFVGAGETEMDRCQKTWSSRMPFRSQRLVL